MSGLAFWIAASGITGGALSIFAWRAERERRGWEALALREGVHYKISGSPVPQRRWLRRALLGGAVAVLLIFLWSAVNVRFGVVASAGGPATSPIRVSFGVDAGQLREFFVWLLYFSLMLLGMAGQYMWGLKNKRDFKLFEFLKPLWVSVIVFTPFWAALPSHAVTYAAAAGAYQNGFFWKIVLDGQEKVLTKPRANKTRNKVTAKAERSAPV